MTNSSPQLIRLRDLSHVHQLAGEDFLQNSSAASRRSRASADGIGVKYEISAMPVGDVIEMVAGLLSKITATNDRPHGHLHHLLPPPEGTAILNSQTSSVLAFHGKNVPTISILSYLSRINRYCPTTYEVFLGLLVYFDRMTERVNSGSLHSLRHGGQGNDMGQGQDVRNGDAGGPLSAATLRSTAWSARRVQAPGQPDSHAPVDPSSAYLSPSIPSEPSPSSDSPSSPQFFVVDNYNIHRLVIAGVTCASKFFSDVFYTNSRYAKVGGLPLVELNHLEIQFLLLNDFQLFVPVEELEAYGTMLVEFYVREVVAQKLSHIIEGSGVSGGGYQTPPEPQ